MVEQARTRASPILTPDQRLRIFVSSTLKELTEERGVVAEAIRSLRMTPVMFELGARPHPPRSLYRSYLEQSHVFVGIYWESYGWIADDMTISGLEDEYLLSRDKPTLIYVKEPAPGREERLKEMLEGVARAGVSYRKFRDAAELRELVADDLAVLLTEMSGMFGDEPMAPPTLATTALPAPASSFVGRDAELQEIAGLLADPDVRLVTLLGTGGIGKTRLALEAAHRAVPSFPGGVVPVWLESIRDPDHVLTAIAAALDVRDVHGSDLLEAIVQRLRDRRMLLLVDNFEHVLEASQVLADLLGAVGDSKLLVTSRALLQLRGEHVVEVGPLPFDHEAHAAEGTRSDAIRLFLDRAHSVAPGFHESQQDLVAVADIVRTVEGVPLAVELAAARVRALPASAIASRLRSCLDILKSGARDLPSRQQTIRDTVRWSYDLLDEEERKLVRRLAVFRGGADIDAIEEVAKDVVSDPLLALASLVDKSLLVRTERPSGEVRFSMLSMIREYARGRLQEEGEDETVRDAHARYFLRMAERAEHEMWSPAVAWWLDTLEIEHENIQAALSSFIARDLTDEALRLATSLRWFWWIRGHLGIGDRWFKRALAMDGASEAARARALIAAGAFTVDLGDLARGRQMLTDAIETFESTGDAVNLAWAYTAMGSVLQALGEADEAGVLQERALEVFDDKGISLGQCTANTALASLAWSRGRYPLAESHYRKSLAARRHLGDPWGTAYVLTALAWTRILQGDLDEASAQLEEALPLFRSVSFRDGLATATNALGYVAAAEDRWDEALSRFEEALELFTAIGNRPGIALEKARLARALLVTQGVEAAATPAREAFDLAHEAGERGALAFAIETAGCVLAAAGSHVEAARLFGATEERRRRDTLLSTPDLPLTRSVHEQEVRDGLGDRFAVEWALGTELSDDDVAKIVQVGLRDVAEVRIATPSGE